MTRPRCAWALGLLLLLAAEALSELTSCKIPAHFDSASIETCKQVKSGAHGIGAATLLILTDSCASMYRGPKQEPRASLPFCVVDVLLYCEFTCQRSTLARQPDWKALSLVQGLEVIQNIPDCRDPVGERCCKRVGHAIAHSCHCWIGIPHSQLSLLKALVAACPALEQGLATGSDSTGATEVGSHTDQVRLFVGVLTTGKNRAARQAIRKTWGSDPRLHRFVCRATTP